MVESVNTLNLLEKWTQTNLKFKGPFRPTRFTRGSLLRGDGILPADPKGGIFLVRVHPIISQDLVLVVRDPLVKRRKGVVFLDVFVIKGLSGLLQV